MKIVYALGLIGLCACGGLFGKTAAGVNTAVPFSCGKDCNCVATSSPVVVNAAGACVKPILLDCTGPHGETLHVPESIVYHGDNPNPPPLVCP